MTRSEYYTGVPDIAVKNLFAKKALHFFIFFLTFPAASSTIQAKEKQQIVRTITNTETAKNADDFLANAEQMIEEMILQIDQQDSSNREKSELADNPNPTSRVTSIPNIKPINGSITSNFGMRLHPLYNLSLFHQGIDISAPEGTGVQTTGDGIVAFSGYEKGYGQLITINHGYGYKTIYAHLSKSLVRQGQKVIRGEVIALSGNTGVSTAPHLHYEVQKDNLKVDPTVYFFHETTPGKFISIQDGATGQRDSHS